MKIRPAEEKDLSRIMEIYHSAQDFMIRSGNPAQWGHAYPTKEIVKADILKGQSFLLYGEDRIHGVFVLQTGKEPTYQIIENGAWLNDEPYITIHRVAGDGEVTGILHCVMEYCRRFSDNIRIDTHEKNFPMRRAIGREGFELCGVVFVRDGSPRIAYQWRKNNGGQTEVK